jgi:hypothetical protein
MERQFLGTFLRLRRLAVDKNLEIAFLVGHEVIKVLLVDLLFFSKGRDTLRAPPHFAGLTP